MITFIVILFLVKSLGCQLAEDEVPAGYSCQSYGKEQDAGCPLVESYIEKERSKRLEGRMPWMVSLQDYRYDVPRHFCGGVIIDRSWVLTTAFCVWAYKKDNIKVVAGEYDMTYNDGWEQLVNVEKIIVHGDFGSFNHDNDIAILKVSPPFEINWKVKPILIQGNISSSMYIGETCKTRGWGMIENSGITSPILTEVNLTIISDRKCRRIYRDLIISESMLCTTTDDIEIPCLGDWGDPLVCGGSDLIGLTSWSNGCGKEYPLVFLEVSHYAKWIHLKISRSMRTTGDHSG